MTDAIGRAEHAKRLADDPMMIEALGNIRGAAIRAWESTAIADAKEREVAWLTVKVVNRIEAELQSIIDGGKIAAHRIQNPVR